MPVLVDLYARYRGQGLEILSIAFEPLDDPKLVAKQVERLKKSYGIAWKSSIRDVDQRSTILKDLENAEGFPITLFVDRNGMVRGMHSGFVSAAIGDDHKKLLEKFETLTKQILETGDGE